MTNTRNRMSPPSRKSDDAPLRLSERETRRTFADEYDPPQRQTGGSGIESIMGWNDRSYYYRENPRLGMGGGFSRYSVVTWLIVANVIIYMIDAILTGSARGSGMSLSRWGYFSVDTAITGGQIWRWFTFQFLHGDIFHIFFNMLVLFFFGPMMEHYWGRARFTAYYLLCGAAGALLFVLFAMVPGLLNVSLASPLIGASAGVFGVLVGCAIVAPNQRVMLLFPPIPLQMRTLVLFVLGFAVLGVVFGARNAGGDAAHLGGAALGFLLMKKPRLISWLNFRGVKAKLDAGRWQRQQRRLIEEEAEIGRILQKVKDHGLHSLTRREKKMLQRETERLRSAG